MARATGVEGRDHLGAVLGHVCPDGCYKHYVKGMGRVCCKCGN
jgi:hypothetical protein